MTTNTTPHPPVTGTFVARNMTTFAERFDGVTVDHDRRTFTVTDTRAMLASRRSVRAAYEAERMAAGDDRVTAMVRGGAVTQVADVMERACRAAGTWR